ncbi:MAG: hypothetical protein JWO46_1319 [Nocardioidaceae bacterium]|nr:hypothetical protein [Nocardioidaceae bacterium]
MRGVVVCALVLAVSGCGHHLTGTAAQACASLVKALPDRVGDQKAGDRDRRTASWGDPEIALTCGVGVPKGFTETSSCQNTVGLDWYVPDDQIGTSPVDVVMTTVGRSPRVQVKVPKNYWPPVAVMSDLTKTILAHTKKTTPCI